MLSCIRITTWKPCTLRSSSLDLWPCRWRQWKWSQPWKFCSEPPYLKFLEWNRNFHFGVIGVWWLPTMKRCNPESNSLWAVARLRLGLGSWVAMKLWPREIDEIGHIVIGYVITYNREVYADLLYVHKFQKCKPWRLRHRWLSLGCYCLRLRKGTFSFQDCQQVQYNVKPVQ